MSAPYSAYISSGVTTFLSDLPIFPYSRCTTSPFQRYTTSPEPSGAGSSVTSVAGTYWPRASVKAYAWT